MGEGVLTDDGLVELHGKTGHRRDIAAGAGDVLGMQPGGVGQMIAPHFQGHDDLFEGGVAGPLADAVDRHFDLPGAGLDASQAVCDREAEVIVTVGGKDNAIGAGDVLDQVAEDRRILAGIGVADGVGDVDRRRPGADRGLNAAAQHIALGAGGVLGRPFHIVAEVAGVGDRAGHEVDDLLGGDPQDVVAVLRAGGEKGVDAAAAGRADGLGAALNVHHRRPSQTADGALGNDAGDAAHGVEIAVGGCSENRPR